MPDGAETRLLVVSPSWVGDAIMATPAMRLLRESRPGAFIGLLARPGIDTLLEGTGLFDEAHVERGSGVMAPKAAAAKVRARRYDAAVLLKNSFSAALAVRMAGIPRRIGYARDARAMLLTGTVEPPLRPDGEWAIVPAVDYYLRLMHHFLGERSISGADRSSTRGDRSERGRELEGVPSSRADDPATTPSPHAPIRLELAVTPQADLAGAEVLARAGLDPLAHPPLAILNPGGNNPAKRWPVDRFAAVADFLEQEHGMAVLVSGSPAERDVVAGVIGACRAARPLNLIDAGVTLSALRAIVARSSLMVTNDTGPRHIAVALGVPVVTLFGPTDHRWTSVPTIPLPDGSSSEEIVLADPTLPEGESANDHPERCRIERIAASTVIAGCSRLLASRPVPSRGS